MNVLVVDDHPMIVDAYYSVLNRDKLFKDSMNFYKSLDCKEAHQIIMRFQNSETDLDLAVIDLGLPPFIEESLLDGSQLAYLIKKIFPNCKVVVITAVNEVLKIYDVVKKIRPEGLLIKSDIRIDNFVTIIKTILDGTYYQSPAVRLCIEQIWTKELMVEDYNRQILLYLSKGYKVKDLDKVINISSSAIEKRIVKMKKAFNVTDDSGLVKESIALGFI